MVVKMMFFLILSWIVQRNQILGHFSLKKSYFSLVRYRSLQSTALFFYLACWLIINYYDMWLEKTHFEARAWIPISNRNELCRKLLPNKLTPWVKDHLNPLSPNSDQHQISPCNIHAYSTHKVMRIKDMIAQGEFSDVVITSPQYFYKKSKGTR